MHDILAFFKLIFQLNFLSLNGYLPVDRHEYWYHVALRVVRFKENVVLSSRKATSMKKKNRNTSETLNLKESFLRIN